MSDFTTLAERYIAAWNETDPGTRRELIARTWAEDGSYLDPLMSGEGHDGINAMIGAAQTQFPGYRFRRTGELDAHNNVVGFGTQKSFDTMDPGDFMYRAFRTAECRFLDTPVDGDCMCVE